MIKTFVGLPGSGKSLYYSWLIATEVRRIKKKRSKYDMVAINFDWNNGEGDFAEYNFIDKTWSCGGFIKAFDDLPELFNEVNLLVFVDEAGYLLNGMDWDKMPPDYKYFLFQHRKNITDKNKKRFDLYIATQHKDIVEVTLRRLTNNIYWIRPLFRHVNPDKPPRFLLPVIRISYYKQHEIRQMPIRQKFDSMGNPEKIDEEDELELLKLVHVYWIGKKYRNMYDTLQKVNKVERKKLTVQK